MDKIEKRKLQNRVAQANRRTKIMEEMGIDKYHEAMAKISRDNYQKRKNKNKNENENIVKMKISTNLYVKDYINEVFNDFINNIPNKSKEEAHIGHIEPIMKKKGRPPVYIIKEGMMENERKLIEQKLKKREYQKKYMANKRKKDKEELNRR